MGRRSPKRLRQSKGSPPPLTHLFLLLSLRPSRLPQIYALWSKVDGNRCDMHGLRTSSSRKWRMVLWLSKARKETKWRARQQIIWSLPQEASRSAHTVEPLSGLNRTDPRALCFLLWLLKLKHRLLTEEYVASIRANMLHSPRKRL